MPFVPHTPDQRARMLREIGMSAEDLFGDIPEELRAKSFDLRPGLSEQQVSEKLRALSRKNGTCLPCFLGAGIYDHYQPAAVDAIISRSEFYTAYTPYQPELSQGTLQAIYEYQSAICRLTGLEVANASLYDGGTALFEGALMAMASKRRRKVVVDSSVNAIHRRMLATYTASLDAEVVTVPHADGRANRAAIGEAVDDDTAAVLTQNPSFFGCLDDLSDVAKIAHEVGALLVVSTYPLALGIIRTPGEMNADVAIGEGQSLGIPMAFGGPWLGFMAATKKLLRKMPGRIAGRTVDAQGREGFVLTLQAREQHIRREKATSNICTNQGLCALMASAYMSLMGPDGLEEVAQLCADKAAYAVERLTAVEGVSRKFADAAYFNEFVLHLPIDARDAAGRLIEKGIAPGVPLGMFDDDLGDCLLVAVTENRTRREIDRYASALEEIL